MNDAALTLAWQAARDLHDREAAALARAGEDRARAQATLDHLQGFRDSAFARVRAGTSLDAALLNERQRFSGQLEQAIRLQQAQVAAAHAAHERQRTRWLAALRRVQAIETLRQRQARMREQAQSRRQQRETDAHAARARGAGAAAELLRTFTQVGHAA